VIKRIILGTLLPVALGALLAATTAAGAPLNLTGAKPGFLPGTWTGKGTIAGRSVDGPMTTTFSGGTTFTLNVAKDLHVSGTGTWRVNMVGTEDADADDAVNSDLRSIAAIKFGGTSTNVTFSGRLYVTGEVTAYGKLRQPVKFDRDLNGRLVITRAGHCKVVGGHTLPGGVTVSWSALLKGSGFCRT
jgi:hypothetical protein